VQTAKQVDDLIVSLKQQVEAGTITLSEAIWQTALACVGWSYVYSAWEELCTPAERRKRFKMCPDKTSIKSKCKAFENNNCHGCQWYPNDERTRCGDCRGFEDFLFKMFGFDLYGDTVSAQWNHKANWCAQGQFGVDPVPQNVYVNVFIKNKKTGKWTHTGGYFNGATCECANGVQYFNPMKKDRWTHWAVAACFKNGWEMPKQPEEPQKEPEKQPEKGQQTVSRPTIRKGNKNKYVKEVQEKLIQLGYNLGICGADGDFGTATEAAVKQFQRDHGLTVDGVTGPKTWEMLLNAPVNPAKIDKYTVTIKQLNKEQAEAIIKEWGGSMKVEE